VHRLVKAYAWGVVVVYRVFCHIAILTKCHNFFLFFFLGDYHYAEFLPDEMSTLVLFYFLLER